MTDEKAPWARQALNGLNLQQKASAMEQFLLELLTEEGEASIHVLIDQSGASTESKAALHNWVCTVAEHKRQAALEANLPRELYQ